MACRLHVACDEMTKHYFIDKIHVKNHEKTNCGVIVGEKVNLPKTMFGNLTST